MEPIILRNGVEGFTSIGWLSVDHVEEKLWASIKAACSKIVKKLMSDMWWWSSHCMDYYGLHTLAI
jgi:hypothetical protein